jgi:hypothetical protein
LALKTNFTYRQSADVKTLYIYDTTGVYNATTNPTGWGGGGNPTVGNAISDKISIQKVGSNTIYEISMYATLPNTNDTPFAIDSSMLGLGPNVEIPDGQYVFTRTTVAPLGTTYTKAARVFLIGQVQCCADAMLDADLPNCGCDSGKLTPASILQYAIWTLKKAFKTQKFEKANEIYRYAQDLCKEKNCKTC